MKSPIKQLTTLKPSIKLSLLSALVLLAACQRLPVSVDYAPDVNFTQLKTYSWYSKTQIPEIGGVADTIFDQRVRSNIDNNLDSKLYQKVTADADFWVTYHYVVNSKMESRNPSVGMGFFSSGSNLGFGVSSGNRVNEYDEGTLYIDFIDTKDESLLWRSNVKKRLQSTPTPEQREEAVKKVVSAALAEFPPQ